MKIGTTVKSPNGTFEVSVLSGGTPQELYRRPGDNKIFTVGVHGRTYTLRVHNLTNGKIEVINTVDGRHTLEDEPGDTSACKGLIFPAHYTGEFTGWRLNDDETRAFKFGSASSSVAAQATGSTSNTGVIGFAVYREQTSYYTNTYSSYPGGQAVASASAGAAAADSATFDDSILREHSLGTGMGEKISDHVGRTTFTRAYGGPDILVIGYETEDVLLAQGILGPAEPNAFPGAGTGYEKYAVS